MSTNKRRKTDLGDDGGRNGNRGDDGDGDGGSGAAEPSKGTVIAGRPEHVDKVDHSGTWHLQLSGSSETFVGARKIICASSGLLRVGQPAQHLFF